MTPATWKAKLTQEQAVEAYSKMHTQGWTCGMCARYYKVARTTMASLRCGKSWGWATGHKQKEEADENKT